MKTKQVATLLALIILTLVIWKILKPYTPAKIHTSEEKNKNSVVTRTRNKATSKQSRTATTRSQLKTTIVPSINFEETSLEDALDFLFRDPTRNSSTQGHNFSFVINQGKRDAPPPNINLQTENIKLTQALNLICKQTGNLWHVEQSSILISPELTEHSLRIHKMLTQDIPQIHIENVSLEEAVDHLRLRQREINSEKMSFSMIIRKRLPASSFSLESDENPFGNRAEDDDVSQENDLPSTEKEKKVTIHDSNKSVAELLDTICEQTHHRWKISEYGLLVLPKPLNHTKK